MFLLAFIALDTLYKKIDFFAISLARYFQPIGFGFLSALFLSPLLRHFILHFLLWQEGKIPLRWVSLLNKLDKKTGILEKDGGQWRFRHQLLQDALGR